MKNLPFPAASYTWHEWGRRLVSALMLNEREPLRPAHKLPGDSHSATEDGVIMYDPAIGELVYSKEGVWYSVRTNTPT